MWLGTIASTTTEWHPQASTLDGFQTNCSQRHIASNLTFFHRATLTCHIQFQNKSHIVQNLRENKNENDSGRLAVPSRLSDLPGRLHINTNTKVLKIHTVHFASCAIQCVWKLQFPLFIRCYSEVVAFSSRFRYHMIYFDFKFSEAVFKRQFLEIKERNKVLF